MARGYVEHTCIQLMFWVLTRYRVTDAQFQGSERTVSKVTRRVVETQRQLLWSLRRGSNPHLLHDRGLDGVADFRLDVHVCLVRIADSDLGFVRDGRAFGVDGREARLYPVVGSAPLCVPAGCAGLEDGLCECVPHCV